MTKFGDKKAAMKMRDIINKMIAQGISRYQPQLGIVDSYDRYNRNATVILNGDTASIQVKMFRTQPLGLGDIVQVSGGPGKYFISDVLSTYGWNASRWFTRLQDSMTGGGTVGFATNNFTWTVRFLLGWSGDGLVKTDISSFAINPPTGGVTVPRYNQTSNTASVTVANGVTMNNAEALYYELPLDNDLPTDFDETRFRLVGNSGLERFDIPEHWILMAIRNTDASSGEVLKIMNGKIIVT